MAWRDVWISRGARASEQACAEIMVWDVDRNLLARSSGRAMVRTKKRVDEDVGRKGRRRETTTAVLCAEVSVVVEGVLKNVLIDLQDVYYDRWPSSGLCDYYTQCTNRHVTAPFPAGPAHFPRAPAVRAAAGPNSNKHCDTGAKRSRRALGFG